jgi:hypothetical protein
LKQRKRAKGIAEFLSSLGISRDQRWTVAASGKGWWRPAHHPVTQQAMNNAWFQGQALVNPLRSVSRVTTLTKTAGYDEYVRWWGRTAGATLPPTRLRAAHTFTWTGQSPSRTDQSGRKKDTPASCVPVCLKRKG